MLKTVKGKVIAGTVAVTLLAGAGAAFGASNAGGKLQDWYNTQFGQANQNIITDVARDAAGKAEGWATDYQGIKTAASNSINDTENEEYTEKSSSIDTAAQEHIDAINNQKDTISNYMETQFNAISSTLKTEINTAGAIALIAANRDITEHTGTKGSAARSSLETELGTVTTEAKADIQDAIDAAKADLTTQLTSETTATTTEIIGMIDAKIEYLKTTITNKKNQLVAAQQALITDKAATLETEAKASLQGIVDGI